MKKNKSSLSKSSSYREIAQFWSTHDLADYWNETKKAFFEVAIESEVTYFAIDRIISEKIEDIAKKRGIDANTLVNLWVQEKIQKQKAV